MNTAYLIRSHIRAMDALRRERQAFARGVIITAVLMTVLFACTLVVAQEIPRQAQEHRRELVRASRAAWGLNAPVAAFAAQVHQESMWRPEARSRAGAEGLTQFTPPTTRWIAQAYPADLSPPEPFSPAWSLRAMTIYNRHLFDRVRAIDGCERMAFAMSAYNGGLGWVVKRKALSPMPGICFGATCEINPGVLPANQKENAEYPKRILLELEPIYVAAGWGPGVCT